MDTSFRAMVFGLSCRRKIDQCRVLQLWESRFGVYGNWWTGHGVCESVIDTIFIAITKYFQRTVMLPGLVSVQHTQESSTGSCASSLTVSDAAMMCLSFSLTDWSDF